MAPRFPDAAAADERIEHIIEKVRSNEELYSNIEISWQLSYEGDRKQLSAYGINFTLSESRRLRFVKQGAMFSVDEHYQGTALNDEQDAQDGTKNYVGATKEECDGSTTRLYHEESTGAVGNIISGRRETIKIIQPHMMPGNLINSVDLVYPLSTYMTGSKAIAAHPNGQIVPDNEVAAVYNAEEIVDGLRCHKVTVNHIVKPTGERYLWREFWLAEERNYLPIQVASYMSMWSSELPTSTVRVSDLRELSSGVWLPYSYECTRFSNRHLKNEGRQVVLSKKTLTIEHASLIPAYDQKEFQQIEFPEGTMIYEINEEGDVVRNYEKGAPGIPEPPSTANVTRNGWRTIMWVNVVAIVAVAMVIILRRYRRVAS